MSNSYDIVKQDTVLQVRNLSTSFQTDEGEVTVLDDVSFNVQRGQTLGLVGESGCGKSVTSLSIMRLLPQPAGQIKHGVIEFDNMDLLALPVEQMHSIRGKRVAMIFQEPMTALNPVQKIGKQLVEIYELHFPEMSKQQMQSSAIAMLEKVGIPVAEKRMQEYPHQLSGGMRQRVVIAMALAAKPDILIADEPTTALDVTIQDQILSLMRELQQEMGMSILFITHNLGVVAQMCDEVAVMYAGHIVEKASVEELFANPKHPYTQGLLNSIPKLEHQAKTRLNTIEGIVPSLHDIASGCRFHDRCQHAIAACADQVPDRTNVSEGHDVACIRWQELSL